MLTLTRGGQVQLSVDAHPGLAIRRAEVSPTAMPGCLVTRGKQTSEAQARTARLRMKEAAMQESDPFEGVFFNGTRYTLVFREIDGGEYVTLVLTVKDDQGNRLRGHDRQVLRSDAVDYGTNGTNESIDALLHDLMPGTVR